MGWTVTVPAWAAMGLAVALIVAPAAPAQTGPDAYTVFPGNHRLPHGGRPSTPTPFPTISDWNTLRIRLERTPCFGHCPAYSVELSGDGEVTYVGEAYVAVTGEHHTRVDPTVVRRLFQAFAKAEFFSTLDLYRLNATDLPMFTMTLSFDGRTKTVDDYGGRAIGMPPEVADLEAAIDAAADTALWIKGDARTIAALRAEGWDFAATDEAHQEMLAQAVVDRDDDFAKLLVAAGTRAGAAGGCQAAVQAAQSRDTAAVALLLDNGAPLHWGQGENVCDVLFYAVHSESPELIRTVLSHGPDAGWRNDFGMTALMNAVGRSGSYPPVNGKVRAEVVELLIAAGAPVNAQDKAGQTALMLSEVPEVTSTLLAGGADPRLTDKDGLTALDLAKKHGLHDEAAILEAWLRAHPAGAQTPAPR